MKDHIGKFVYVKMYNFCTPKHTMNKVKRQATVRKKIFAMHIIDRNQYPGHIINY